MTVAPLKPASWGAFAALALFAAAPSFAQQAGAPGGQTDAAPTSPPMWRLADEDSEIWLLGTFHILPPALDWRTEPLVRALDAAETLWFEAETDTAVSRQTTLQIVMTEGYLKEGRTLSGLLGSERAEDLKAITADVGLPFSAIDVMRPWQAFLTLSVQAIVNQGYDPNSGMDTVLLREARARARDLRFFETVEEQLGLFTSLPAETEKNLLAFTIEDWENQAEEIDDLYGAWRIGDIDTIDAMMNEALRTRVPTVYDALVKRRNEAWTDEIARAMAGSGKILVAVGAGHMAGADSVPAMLRARGFTVERYGASETEAPEPGLIGEDASGEDPPADDPIGDLLREQETP